MRFGRFLPTCTAFVLLAATVATAQPPESKPAAPDANLIPGTFRSFIVLDKRTLPDDALNRTNKLHCLVTENNLNPVVAVFARSVPEKAAGDPLTNLVFELKKLTHARRSQNFGAFAIFVTLDSDFQPDAKRDTAAGAVATWGNSIPEWNPMKRDTDKPIPGPGSVVLGLAGLTSDAVKKWKLDKDNDITVVLYHRMKLVREPWTFAEGKLTDADVKAILAAAEAELGKK